MCIVFCEAGNNQQTCAFPTEAGGPSCARERIWLAVHACSGTSCMCMMMQLCYCRYLSTVDTSCTAVLFSMGPVLLLCMDARNILNSTFGSYTCQHSLMPQSHFAARKKLKSRMRQHQSPCQRGHTHGCKLVHLLCNTKKTTDLLISFGCVLSSASTPALNAVARIAHWCKLQQDRTQLTLQYLCHLGSPRRRDFSPAFF